MRCDRLVMRILYYTICFLFLASCVSHVSTTSTQTKYSEDISSLRPKTVLEPDETTTSPETNGQKQTAYVEPTHNINKQLDAVLDSISRIHLGQKYIEGYSIQVYSGTKRDEALDVKKKLVL